jgi:hypothetical protein
MKKLIFSFATIALAVASAASYNVTLYQPSQVGDKQLQPGEYKVELHENTAVFSKGKEKVEANVKVEAGERKNQATSIRYGVNSEIQQIRLKGTNTTLVFSDGQTAVKAEKNKVSMLK